MPLTKIFTPATFARALEDWSWLDIRDMTPVCASLFGDVFFQDSRGYWFLDTIEGMLTQVASSRDELQAKLDSEEGQDQYLLGGLVMAADREGLHLKSNEVYDFQIAPILGGKTDLTNVTTMDFEVSMSLSGQLHDQVRDLAPGTPISGVKVIDGRLRLV